MRVLRAKHEAKMTKKDEKEVICINENGVRCMSGEQYWRWRAGANDLIASQERSARADWYHKFHKANTRALHFEGELATIRAREASEEMKRREQAAHEEYQELRAQLEKELGVSLKNCTIDDETHAIIPLDGDEGKSRKED